MKCKNFGHWELNYVNTFILALILFFSSGLVSADTNMANRVLKDFKLASFNDAKLVVSEIDSDANNYRLALGSIRKKQNQLRPEIEISLSGKINHLTYEVDREYDPQEVFQYFLDQLKNSAFDILYQCHAAECGSNTHWANRIFKQSVLNGLERSQHYIVARLNIAETPNLSRYIVLYLVQRGNKRLYFHFDLISALDDQVNPILESQFYYEQLKVLKRVRVRGLSITKNYQVDLDGSKNTINSIAYLLRTHPELKLVIVGHAYDVATIATNRENSLLLANSFKGSLEQQGLQNTLLTYGLGPLAPSFTDVSLSPMAWVELIVVPEL